MTARFTVLLVAMVALCFLCAATDRLEKVDRENSALRAQVRELRIRNDNQTELLRLLANQLPPHSKRK